uniref:Uncharacterized protein n=1 Tax=Nelumbo nucifera TaxID=4432 RepID=A0A822XQE7_NELNU|nr:TPA_asm: hypothetical protein HUJ06_024020 [Nelumbo nucifera]
MMALCFVSSSLPPTLASLSKNLC